MITVPTSVTTALQSGVFNFCLAIALPGSGAGTRRVTDHWKNISYGGNTYLSQSDVALVNVGDVKRQLEVGSDALTLQFDNTDNTLYSEYILTNHVGKFVTITALFTDADGDILAADAGMQVYTGLVDSWGLTESSSNARFALKLTSHWAAWKIKKSRYTNSESQEELYAGDTLFEFAHQEDLPIKWGL